MNRLKPHPIRVLIALALAFAATALIAACGGDDGGGGDEDPQELLDATFSNEEQIDSGAFELSLEVVSEGGENAGDLKATLGGPFESAGDGKVPLFDVDAEIDLNSEVQDFSGSAGITSTGEQAFVNFQDTEYEVPAEVFGEFAQNFTQLQEQNQTPEGGNFLSSIGINPANWLTDLDNEGDEDVEGTDTVHISGTADVPKLVEDIKKIAENSPEAAEQLGAQDIAELDELTDIVEAADFDIYTGADDDLLRKFEADLKLNPPDVSGSPESVDITFALTLSGLNDPQEIAAPSGAKPLSDLLGQFGLDEGSLGDAIGGGTSGALPEAGGSPSGPSNTASQEYLECIRTAQGDAALQECSALLE